MRAWDSAKKEERQSNVLLFLAARELILQERDLICTVVFSRSKNFRRWLIYAVGFRTWKGSWRRTQESSQVILCVPLASARRTTRGTTLRRAPRRNRKLPEAPSLEAHSSNLRTKWRTKTRLMTSRMTSRTKTRTV